MGHDDSWELIERVSRAYFENAIPGGTYYGVLAEAEGAGVVGGGGVVIVSWPGSGRRSRPLRPWILNVYVQPQFRRRGIARAIMEALIGWCRSQDFDCICLHASTAGRPLYERLGFEPTNEMRLNLTPSGAARSDDLSAGS
jgi:GNAT superfamily N-acetyltransferase